jgi:hypothetical protein
MKTYKMSIRNLGFLAWFMVPEILFPVSLMANDVMGLLQGYEWKASEILEVSLQVDDAEEQLIGIASDETQPNFIPGRAATTALTIYPSDRVWALYSARIKTSHESPVGEVSRRRTVDTICKSFLLNRVGLMPTSLLNEEDAYLRVRVAQCLENIELETAKSVLGIYRAGIGDLREFKAYQVIQ